MEKMMRYLTMLTRTCMRKPIKLFLFKVCEKACRCVFVTEHLARNDENPECSCVIENIRSYHQITLVFEHPKSQHINF